MIAFHEGEGGRPSPDCDGCDVLPQNFSLGRPNGVVIGSLAVHVINGPTEYVVCDYPRFVAAGDMDGNSAAEVIVVNRTSKNVSVLSIEANGSLTRVMEREPRPGRV